LGKQELLFMNILPLRRQGYAIWGAILCLGLAACGGASDPTPAQLSEIAEKHRQLATNLWDIRKVDVIHKQDATFKLDDEQTTDGYYLALAVTYSLKKPLYTITLAPKQQLQAQATFPGGKTEFDMNRLNFVEPVKQAGFTQTRYLMVKGLENPETHDLVLRTVRQIPAYTPPTAEYTTLSGMFPLTDAQKDHNIIVNSDAHKALQQQAAQHKQDWLSAFQAPRDIPLAQFHNSKMFVQTMAQLQPTLHDFTYSLNLHDQRFSAVREKLSSVEKDTLKEWLNTTYNAHHTPQNGTTPFIRIPDTKIVATRDTAQEKTCGACVVLQISSDAFYTALPKSPYMQIQDYLAIDDAPRINTSALHGRRYMQFSPHFKRTFTIPADDALKAQLANATKLTLSAPSFDFPKMDSVAGAIMLELQMNGFTLQETGTRYARTDPNAPLDNRISRADLYIPASETTTP
jgi:hypothetical protein